MKEMQKRADGGKGGSGKRTGDVRWVKEEEEEEEEEEERLYLRSKGAEAAKQGGKRKKRITARHVSTVG